MLRDEIIEIANESGLCQSIWIDSPDENLASVIRFAEVIESRVKSLCAAKADIALLGTHVDTRDRVLRAIYRTSQL